MIFRERRPLVLSRRFSGSGPKGRWSRGSFPRLHVGKFGVAFSNPSPISEAINRYIKAHNKTSKPFEWSASPASIFKSSPKSLNHPNGSLE
ncbi:hypothetical protein IVB21_09385 [Bradyrhizobium sp. 18]|nr:hypothetical protein [Bradyrhizobium sp. 23]MCK1505120.1 hypothetical protein [Bradyrhizobium sp. 18]